MAIVKLTELESRCRGGHFQSGDVFYVDDLCPPLCHELWHAAYPYVFALQNGGDLDCGQIRTGSFTVRCPDEGRVILKGEVVK